MNGAPIQHHNNQETNPETQPKMHHFLGCIPTQYPIIQKKFANGLLFEKESDYYEILEVSVVDNDISVVFQYSQKYIEEWYSRWVGGKGVEQTKIDLAKKHGFTLDENGILVLISNIMRKNIIEIGKHHAKFARRISRIIQQDNMVAVAPKNKQGLFLYIFDEPHPSIPLLAKKIPELLNSQSWESNNVIGFQLSKIEQEFKGHFVTRSIFYKNNVRYKIQRYYNAIHDYLNFIDIVKISLNRLNILYNDEDWKLAKETANSTECMFQRKERHSQELRQAVSSHINISGIFYTVIGVALGIMATGLSMDGDFWNSFSFENILKSTLFYFGATVGLIGIPIIWYRIGMKDDLGKTSKKITYRLNRT